MEEEGTGRRGKQSGGKSREVTSVAEGGGGLGAAAAAAPGSSTGGRRRRPVGRGGLRECLRQGPRFDGSVACRPASPHAEYESRPVRQQRDEEEIPRSRVRGDEAPPLLLRTRCRDIGASSLALVRQKRNHADSHVRTFAPPGYSTVPGRKYFNEIIE